ncbi:MAG: hypothetical protein HY302_04850 [Opitutae bacterium]|nr:hypothetical protein [Opitutae bacterium]
MTGPPAALAAGRPALSRHWYAATLLVCVLLPTLLSLRYPPPLANDAVYLSLSWNHFVRTGEFARLPQPDSANLAVEHAPVLTWWTPGPAVLIGSGEKLGLTWGHSLSLWLGITAWLQIAGWRRLYARLGYSANLVAWAVVIGAVGWTRLYSFRHFLGGDMFAAALLPWAGLLLLGTLRRPWWTRLGVVAAVTLLGVFFKLSFLVTAAGLGVAAWLLDLGRLGFSGGEIRRAVARGLPLGAGLVLAWLLLRLLFLSRGVASPGSAHEMPWSWPGLLHAGAMSFVLPLSSIVAFLSLGGKTCDLLGWAHLEDNAALLAAAVAVAAALYAAIARTNRQTVARAFLLGLGAVYFGAFTFLYARSAAVSYEDRLFIPFGLFLLPALLSALAASSPRWLRLAGALALVAGSLWGGGSYAYRMRELIRHDVRSERGYGLFALPPAVDHAVRELDRRTPAGDSLFASPDPEALLAVTRHRIALLAPAALHGKLFGRVATLVVILPPHAAAPPMLATFVDYPAGRWHSRSVDDWTIWVQENPGSP